MRRRLWSLAALAMLAVSVAGCGNGATSSGNGTAASGGNGTGSVHQKAVRFAECMRSNGVGGFPDPDASGRLTVDAVANRSSVDTNGAAWKRAIAACKNLEPPGFTGGNVTPSQRRARLEFARCIRENGVPDFPDPTPNGPLIDTDRIPSAATAAGMSALHAAMQKCGNFARAAGVTGP